MVTALHIVSYAAAVVSLAFVTLSLASGLLWLAEVIEEHSRTAKIIGKRACYGVIAFHVLLYFVDGDLPLKLTLFSIACHLVYLLNFANFPLISLTSWSFIASCLLVVTDHFLWFFHFHDVTEKARRVERRWRHPMEPVPHIPTFLDIVTFFGTCVWLLPLFLFLSLSANDNALPTANRRPHDSSTTLMPAFDGPEPRPPKSQRTSLFVLLSAKAMSLFSSRRRYSHSRRNSADGLIAPRSISRPPSPLHDVHQTTLLPPGFQRHSSSPGTSSSALSPGSPLHSPVASPTSPTFGSWVPVNAGGGSRPSTPGAGGIGDENVTRRRVSLQPPLPKRAASYMT